MTYKTNFSYKYFILDRCPEGFVENDKRCYGFFVNRHDKTTWQDAQKKCRSFNGGDLVTVVKKEESTFLAQKTLEINPELRNEAFYMPWIGLRLRRKPKSKYTNDYLHFYLVMLNVRWYKNYHECILKMML